MNIQDLPSEILEKILVEGNFLSVSRVCQTWRDYAERKKSQFNEIFFDLTKDDPEKIEKENPKVVYMYNSPLSDKNEFCLVMKDNKEQENFTTNEYTNYIIEKICRFFIENASLNVLNFIFDSSLLIKKKSKDLMSNDDIIINGDRKMYETIIGWFSVCGICLLYYKINFKIVNIRIKDVFDQIENINQNIFLNFEIEDIYKLFHFQIFKLFKKFTLKEPNNTYIIYDENKKLFIIRFGNYEKYNFLREKTSTCQNCIIKDKICLNINHKQYSVDIFKHDNDYLYKYYPAGLIELNFNRLFTKNVKKLIVISSEFHDFMFDHLLETSKNQKRKKIEYHCFDPNKTKFERKNFKYVPVEKEKEQEYSFDQMHFKYFGENAF